MHNFGVAKFYYDARYEHQHGGLKGAQSRLKEIETKYPNFSYMDEVLFRLANTYQQEEEPDEAAKYYQRVVRDYPNSEFVEKATEQLAIIGAPVPDPDPARKSVAPAEHPGFMGNLMLQVAGKADVTVGKDGILISRDRKAGQDLIDQALEYNGQLPVNTTPVAPVQRREPPKPKANESSNNQSKPPAVEKP